MKNIKNIKLNASKKGTSSKKYFSKSKVKVSKIGTSQKREKLEPEKITQVVKEDLVKIIATEEQSEVKGNSKKKQKKNKEKLEKGLLNDEQQGEKVTQVIKEDLVKIISTKDAQSDVKGNSTKKLKKNKDKLEKRLLSDEHPKGKFTQVVKEDGAQSDKGNSTKNQKKNIEQFEKMILNDEHSMLNGNKKEIKTEELAKIEKKKAKKLAQKLKKQQKKAAYIKEIESEIKRHQKSLKSKIPNLEKKVQNDENTNSIMKGTVEKPPTTNLKKLRKAEKKREQKELKDNDDKETKKEKRDPAASKQATVFVGNLPVNTKRIQLVRLFQDYGPVGAIRFRTAGGKIIMKHKQRKEAGTLNAYLVLKDQETAERAIALNGTEFKSNHLRVTLADKNAHNAVNTESKHMVFIGNLKFSATDEKLREIFSSCGEIEYVRCLRAGEKGCQGVAYVCFKTPEAVGLALELNETMLDERPIHVERYSVKKLGAKEKRDSNKPTQATGAKKRLDQKNKHGNQKSTPQINDDKKKKTEFRGVKVDGIKKKQKQNKKPTSQLKQLAKKIAPKT